MISQLQQLKRYYNLEPHKQGGFFTQTYRSPKLLNNRTSMTVIYYLLEKSSPLAVWHVNKSDIMHFHLKGGALQYDVISPEGKHERFILRQNFKNGQNHQLLVKGGFYKATTLIEGQYGLIGQAVSPGFQYEDMTVWTEEDLSQKFPQLENIIHRTQTKTQINQK